MDEDTRLKARESLLRSRIYRFMALVFAALGLVLFVFLFFRYIEGDILHALKNPAVLLILVVPFLPAVILSGMAVKAEKKLAKLIAPDNEAAGAAKK